MRASLIVVLAGVVAPGCATTCPGRHPMGPPAAEGRGESQLEAMGEPASSPGNLAPTARPERRDVASRPGEVVPPTGAGSMAQPPTTTIVLPTATGVPGVATPRTIAPITVIVRVEAEQGSPIAVRAEAASMPVPAPSTTTGPATLPPSKPEPSTVTVAMREDTPTAPPAPPDPPGEAPTSAKAGMSRVEPPPPPPRVEPGTPRGRPVAQVGDEVITLPELTGAVKARLAQLPPGSSPSRREVIALAQSVLKGMVVRSLVLQEARDVLGGPTQVAEAIDRAGTRWDREELPAVLRREGVAGVEELRAKLGARSGSPEWMREEFAVRSLALEMMRKGGTAGDLDGYLEALRRRRPITSIMGQAELMAAGKRAASEGRAGR